MNPIMISRDFDVFSVDENAAVYKNLNRGDMVSDGENFGTIAYVCFDGVLVNWQGINPEPLPPMFYPASVWDYQFGDNYKIETYAPAGTEAS